MLNTYKNYLVMIIFVLLSLGVTNGFVFAYSTQITLDAREDAGLYPGQPAFLRFLDSDGIYHDGPLSDPHWTSPADVFASAKALGITGVKRLESAGNIWSSDLSVGESLFYLHAGTYRITPLSGAYQYDAFGWSTYKDLWWWELYVKVQDEYTVPSYYMLGSTVGQDSASDAFSAFTERYIDISVMEGGSLSFWIWDWDLGNSYGNSIDNSGDLTFNVTSVPEPSTFLLLTMGLAFLIRRIRS